VNRTECQCIRRWFSLQMRYALAAVLTAFAPVAAAQSSLNVVIQWNKAALQGVRDSKLGPPMVARALAIVHTCAYDAWAAYDDNAIGTQLGGRLRRTEAERTIENKNEAISFAAYRALVDLMPVDKSSVYDPLMAALGYDPTDLSTDVTRPQGIGNVACAAVLNFRHSDGSNQLNGYTDYTGYMPVNPPSTVPVNPATILDVNHWQPLQYVDATGTFVTQKFVGPFWGSVTAFAMTSGDEFSSVVRQFGPAQVGSRAFEQQAFELVKMSARLTDKQKIIAEYWANGPHTELPPGHWDLFAQFVSARDHHTLDDDAKMFFALTNAIFDAGIAAWDAKREFDSVRPVSAIPYLLQGRTIRCWGGPGLGTVSVDGSQWLPYQPSTFPTPPFAEFISGHSAFSAAGATILRLWTGSDRLGDSVTFLSGSSSIEPGITPAAPVTLVWPTFTAAANEAGISRRYGGIHFKTGDLVGRLVGQLVGEQAWSKAKTYFRGEQDGSNGQQADPRNATLEKLQSEGKVATRIVQRSHVQINDLSKGEHLFQCCIHP
jgi:membrane-associated phospholipid phosphatase